LIVYVYRFIFVCGFCPFEMKNWLPPLIDELPKKHTSFHRKWETNLGWQGIWGHMFQGRLP